MEEAAASPDEDIVIMVVSSDEENGAVEPAAVAAVVVPESKGERKRKRSFSFFSDSDSDNDKEDSSSDDDDVSDGSFSDLMTTCKSAAKLDVNVENLDTEPVSAGLVGDMDKTADRLQYLIHLMGESPFNDPPATSNLERKKESCLAHNGQLLSDVSMAQGDSLKSSKELTACIVSAGSAQDVHLDSSTSKSESQCFAPSPVVNLGGLSVCDELPHIRLGVEDAPHHSGDVDHSNSAPHHEVGAEEVQQSDVGEEVSAGLNEAVTKQHRQQQEEVVVPAEPGQGFSMEDRFYACCGSEAPFLDQKRASSFHFNKSSQAASSQVSDGDDFYGMGQAAREAIFETFKISSLHKWQSDMLQRHIRDEGGMKNALTHAPTSGGKTLVAVILLIRTMLLEKKDGVLALPYVAIVTEKVHELKQLANKLPIFAVSEYAGSKGIFPVPKQKSSLRTLYICTPEKATGVWKNLCGDGRRREEIGLAVVDECHMIGDGPRGGVIEELFVGLIRWASPSMRILALSATIGNPEVFQAFLGGGRPSNCKIYKVTNRPTKIVENLVVSGATIPIVRDTEGRGTIVFSERRRDIISGEEEKMFEDSKLFQNDQDKIIARLVLESMGRGDSVLVFCNTRKMCVSLCSLLSNAYQSLPTGGCDKTSTYLEEVKKQRSFLIDHLKSESKGLVDVTLLSGIAVGIGFHSAELHPIERSAIEDAFKRRILSVLCCTTTLAAGVNLPASRVIIRSPTCGGKGFITCAQYMQMVGRAGRTNTTTESGSKADAYILVQPNDVVRFQNLVKQHVEDMKSQLSQVSSHYQRSRSSRGTEHHEFTGITRIIINSLSMDRAALKCSDLIDVYKLTLHYQSGKRQIVDGKEYSLFSIGPFLKELQVLLKCGHIQLVSPDSPPTEDSVLIKVINRSQFDLPSCFDYSNPSSVVSAIPPLESESLKAVSPLKVDSFLQGLSALLEEGEDSDGVVTVTDHYMTLSPIATASSAGSLSLDDAENFVREAEQFEKELPLGNPLVVLYLSVTEAMSKPLVLDPLYWEQENYKNARLVDKMLARDFKNHPDHRSLVKIGLAEESLVEWVFGNPAFRQNDKFNEMLTRVWSALFITQLLANPNNLEQLCSDYGIDRPMAIELSSMLASRLQNLKNFCIALSRFWWYRPLASHLTRNLGKACEEDVRPLLVLRHVTVERAKNLLKLGLHSVQDVAAVFPPTFLSDNMPHLSKWMAVEIVLDARMLVAEEAAVYEAESCDRRKLLI